LHLDIRVPEADQAEQELLALGPTRVPANGRPYAQAAVHGPQEIPGIAEIRALTEDSRVGLER
jgi:hypothetical protein